MPETVRSRNKATRRTQFLTAATSLFAQRGFTDVSLEELGAAVGVSGPAVYRHFANKDAVLAELLISVSQRLIAGGEATVAESTSDRGALEALISFQTDFALSNRDLIRIQDRDLSNLSAANAEMVRTLQRSYINLWISVLKKIQPDVSPSIARTKVQATFGLINSTPHSTHKSSKSDISRKVLINMAKAALYNKEARRAFGVD